MLHLADFGILLVLVDIFIFTYMSVWAILLKVPFIRTNREIARKMVSVANIKEGGLVYDLGCGDGTILFEAEKKGAKCIGFERIWTVCLWGRFRNFLQKQSVEFRCEDFYASNLSDPDIIFCYLSDPLMEKLYVEKYKEIKPGAKIISNMFQIKSISPTRIEKVGDKKVFIYEK